MKFEWDDNKAKRNLKKHGVSFQEASTVFDDAYSVTLEDLEHSFEELRYIEIGFSENDRLLLVVYTERGSQIRIISARSCTGNERKIYDSN
jgi:uncharacterized protein